MTGPRFAYCPACARDLAAPATPTEDQEHDDFDLTAPRCSGCNKPWLVCACPHAGEGALPGVAGNGADDLSSGLQARQHALTAASADVLSEIAGKVRRGELGTVDAFLLLTVDATSVPNRLGTAIHRLDQGGLLFVLESTVASMKQGLRTTQGGILLPN